MLTTKTAQSLDVNGPEKYFVNNHCVELCFTPEQGRFMRSKKLIKSGEIVLTVEPYAITVAEEFKTFGCFNCMQVDLNEPQMFKCADCNNVWYCSTKCQEEAAAWHAPICVALKSLIKVAHVDDWTKSTVRLLLQMYLRRYVEEKKVIIGQSNGNVKEGEISESIVNNISQISINAQNNTNNNNNSEMLNMDVNNNTEDVNMNNGNNQRNYGSDEKSYELSWRDVAVLISNRSLFNKGNMSYFNDLRRILLNVTHKAPLKLDANENFIETMCQLIQNGFGVRKYGNFCYGYAIYPVASYFNHSCWPNLVFDQRGKLMHFVALHDIPEKTELNISYIPLNETGPVRQKKLLTDYHFKCLCPGCRPKPKKEKPVKSGSEEKNNSNSGENSNNENTSSSEELFTSQKRKKKKRSRWTAASNNNSGGNRHHFIPNTNKESNTDSHHMSIDAHNTTEEEDTDVDAFQRDYVCQAFECEGKGLIYKTAHGQRLCNLCLQSPDIVATTSKLI
jgi:SET and MYND domain-containing protein